MNLHIYAQPFAHQEAWIVGTKAELIKLRDALNNALETGKAQGVRTFTGDGEGYSALVVPIEQDQFETLCLPYVLTEKMPGIVGQPGRHTTPFHLVTRERYRELILPLNRHSPEQHVSTKKTNVGD